MGALAAARSAPRPLVGEIRSDGFRLLMSLAFAPEAAALAKVDHGASWLPSRRTWAFPSADHARRFAAALERDPALWGRYAFNAAAVVDDVEVATQRPEPDLVGPELDVRLFPVTAATGGGTILRSRFDPLLLEACRALGGRFLRGRDGWHLPAPLANVLTGLAEKAGVLRGHVYVHEGEVQLSTEGAVSSSEQRPSMALGDSGPERDGAAVHQDETSDCAMGVPVSALAEVGYTGDLDVELQRFGLLDHQPAGVKHLLGRTSALLADDMGLGKSRQAAVAMYLVPGAGCAVLICPASLRIKWMRDEIRKIDPDGEIVILDKVEDVVREPRWLIASYERLGDLVEMINAGKIQPRVMAVDEAHLLKEERAARTMNAFLLAQKISRRYLLTATPILNRESELIALLKLSGHPLTLLPPDEFRDRYVGSEDARRALSEAVADWMLRRPKAVLKLEGKVHELVPLELEGDRLAEYRSLLADPSLRPLPKLTKIRQLLERAKADWLINIAVTMAPDDKLIIFCIYTDTVDYMVDEFVKAGIGAVKYTGAESLRKRQAANDSFQRDAETRVFIGTIGAAGVGIDLTEGNIVAFASLPWTAAMKRQAEDRAYRHGQKRLVTVLIPTHVGTIDERVLELVEHKERIERELLEPSSADEAQERAEERRAAETLLAA